MLPVSKTVAADVLKATKGTFFSVTFLKRSDGTVRNMHCRTGVRKYTTGDGLKYNPSQQGLLPVWEMSVGYKMIPLTNVISFKAFGANFTVPDAARQNDPM